MPTATIRKTEPLHYYPWHYRDFRANRKVRRMCWQARGLYRELLDEYWDVGSLPVDHVELADICGCTVEEFLQYWPEMCSCFPVVDGRLTNPKMDLQRTLRDQERVLAAINGSIGGKTRAENARRKLAEAGATQPPLEAFQPPLDPPSRVASTLQARREEQSIAEESTAEELPAPSCLSESTPPSESEDEDETSTDSGDNPSSTTDVVTESDPPTGEDRDKRSQEALDLAKIMLRLSGWDTFTEDDLDTAGEKLWELLGQHDVKFLDACITWTAQEKYWQSGLQEASFPGAWFASHFASILKQFAPVYRSKKRSTLDDPDNPNAGLLRKLMSEE